MAEAKFYAYVHRTADTDEVFYVGKGKGKRAWSKANRNPHWHHVANKHGWKVQIVAANISESEALRQERVLIALYRAAQLRIVNMTDGGEGVSGLKRAPETEETRAKKRASALGRKMSPEAIAKTSASRVGKKLPEETVRKIKESLAGRRTRPPLSRDAVERIASANRGRTHTDEARAKMSAKAKGSTKRPQSEEHRAKIAQKRREYWDRVRAEKAALA